MDIKPIKTRADYEAALEEIDQLWGADPDSPQGDKLHVLITLIEAYEEQHHAVLPPDPVEAILHRLDSQGLSRRDLEPYLGSRAQVSEILNRKRAVSLAMIRRLQDGLGVSAEILVQQYALRSVP